MSDREEELYHESARELARMVVELETTVEGLGGERDEALELLKGRNERVDQLKGQILKHQTRYSAAMRMIERRQAQLTTQITAYRILARQHTTLSTAVAEANKSVRALKDVPVSELDNAIDTVVNLIDTALLS